MTYAESGNSDHEPTATELQDCADDAAYADWCANYDGPIPADGLPRPPFAHYAAFRGHLNAVTRQTRTFARTLAVTTPTATRYAWLDDDGVNWFKAIARLEVLQRIPTAARTPATRDELALIEQEMSNAPVTQG